MCRLLPALRLSRDVPAAHRPRRPPPAMMVRLRALLARLRALLLRLLALWIRLRARRLHLLVLWVHLWVRKKWVVVWFVAGLRLGVWYLLVSVVGMWLLRVWVKGRWWMCGVCVWLVLMSLRLRGLLVGGWPCRVFLRTRPAVVPLRMAGVARVCVASGWALRSGTCRPGCALVGAASYTNGLGMALLTPPLVPRAPRPTPDGYG